MGERTKRVTIWLERAALGAIMTVAAVIVERRLLRALHRRGEEPRSGRAGPPDLELSAATQDVHQ